MYCGDETGSFVGEVGSHTSRFGYGGDDAPKFVVPSCCLPTKTTTATATAEQQQQQQCGPGGTTVGSRRGKYTVRLQCATSCYRWRGGAEAEADEEAPAACTADYRTPLRRAQMSSESAASAAAVEPIVDPNCFLSQGESIDDWDAYASLWESAMDALHVRDPAKHNSNAGGGNSSSSCSSSKSPRTQPDHASGLSSTNLSTPSRPSSSQQDAALVHPMLVIRPGFTHMYGTCSNNTDPAHDAASEAMEVDDKDGNAQESIAISKLLIHSQQHQDQKRHHRAEMERLVELFMEDFGARAVFVAPAPMLAAFSHGRQTALVVDVGASGWYVGLCLYCLLRVAPQPLDRKSESFVVASSDPLIPSVE